jgi:FkbM family methyltransferase
MDSGRPDEGLWGGGAVSDVRSGPGLLGTARALGRYVSRPDVRQDPVRLLGRRLRFEMERRLGRTGLELDHVARFDGHLTMSLRLADVIERSIYLYGYHDFGAASVFGALVAEGMVVVDAGAHVGQFSLMAGRRVGTRGRVLSFEPAPGVRSRLERNVALSDLDNVTVFPVALSDEAGCSWLYFNEEMLDNSGTASLEPAGDDGRRMSVQTSRLDSVLEGLGVRGVDVLKVDVERLERRVLEGASSTLCTSRPAVLFEANASVDAEGGRRYLAIEFLESLGYRVYGIDIDRHGRWRLRRVGEGEDPLPYRERWQALNLVALHPDRLFLADLAVRGVRC